MEALKWAGYIVAASLVLAVVIGIVLAVGAVVAIGGALACLVMAVLVVATGIKGHCESRRKARS